MPFLHNPSARFALAIGISLLTSSAMAQTIDTIERITKTHVINLGVRDASSPFSTLDPKTKKAIGYSIDICYKIVDSLKKDLKLPDLRAQEVVVTASDRLAKLKNGTIDMECGSTVITKPRMKEVDFSYAVLFGSQRMLVSSKSSIKSQIDLGGVTVAVIKDSTGEKLMRALKAREVPTVKIMTVANNEEALAALESGKAQAVSQLDAILQSLRLRAKNPNSLVITEWPLTVEPLGFPVRKNDAKFLGLVNNSIRSLFGQNDFKLIYGKWFGTAGKPVQFSALMTEHMHRPNTEPGMAFIAGVEL